MFSELDYEMMGRALQLARCGMGHVSPNPMVGAVITNAEGLIIGEGYHRQWGGPHAEVNAVNSVKDKSLLREATIYVTLEPCSHYGKTPPCAMLLKECGFKRVVIACTDPFKEVSGRGIAILREAGIEVETGLYEREALRLNRRFVWAHTRRRPYVTLKWAQTLDGFMGADGEQMHISSPLTRVLMHRERAMADAIMVGSGTVIADNPSLTCRLWPNRRLRPVVLDRRARLTTEANIMNNPETILFSGSPEESPEAILDRLYSEYGITSLLVEGGRLLLDSFLKENLWQELRVEVATTPHTKRGSVPAPQITLENLLLEDKIGDQLIYRRVSEKVSELFGEVYTS